MNEQAILAALAKNPALLAMLASGLAASTKASATSPLAVPPHGPGGLLSTYGLEPDIMNAMVLPMAGLEGRLPVKPSNFFRPVFGILTGQTASTGEEPDAACETPRRAGNLKLCQQYWPFGRITLESQVIRIDNAGLVIDRSEFLDHRIVGNPFADVPMPLRTSPQDALKNKYAKAVLELMTDLARDYKHLTFDGDPANTPASEGYIEWNGLDRLIATGYQDVQSRSRCPAADAAVIDFASALVQDNAASIVSQIVDLYAVRLKYLAEQLRLDVKWAIVMRYGAFRALTQVWPCVYETYRCQTASPGSTTSTVFVDGREQENMRQAMRSGHYLLIDGEQVEVIIDDSIVESIGAQGGQGTSDIYFVPLTVNGTPATYYEYFNFRGPEGAQAIIEAMGGQASSEYMVSPDGRFLFHFLPATYWCKQVAVVQWKRLILRAPFLSAKITDVGYSWLNHEREFNPNDPYYFVDGGAYTMDGYTPPYFYPPLNA